MSRTIPNPVCAVVGEVLGSHYYRHARLESLFKEQGAPGEPPEGNCVNKCINWLKRRNSDSSLDSFRVLGGVLEEFMEVEISQQDFNRSQWEDGRDRVQRILARYGLSYRDGGLIVGSATGTPTRSLLDMLRSTDFEGVDYEFDRALSSIDDDPEDALTAACSVVESLCKIFIEDEALELPSKQTIGNLWKVVAGNLGFNPSRLEDDDLKRILSGLASIVDGLGALRTHAGSAHGRGRTRYKLSPRHARLAVHSAHTLVIFVMESWDEKKLKASR